MTLYVVRIPENLDQAPEPRLLNLIDENDPSFFNLDLNGDNLGSEYYIGRVGWWPDQSIMVQVLSFFR